MTTTQPAATQSKKKRKPKKKSSKILDPRTTVNGYCWAKATQVSNDCKRYFGKKYKTESHCFVSRTFHCTQDNDDTASRLPSSFFLFPYRRLLSPFSHQ